MSCTPTRPVSPPPDRPVDNRPPTRLAGYDWTRSLARDWPLMVAHAERQGLPGRLAVAAYRAGVSVLTCGVGYPTRARLDGLLAAACEVSQSPAVRPEPAASGIDVTAAAGHLTPIGAAR